MTIDMVSVNLKIVGMIKGFTSEENEVLKWIIIWWHKLMLIEEWDNDGISLRDCVKWYKPILVTWWWYQNYYNGYIVTISRIMCLQKSHSKHECFGFWVRSNCVGHNKYTDEISYNI